MTFIYFILILGITIFIHEFGHFLFAKRYGVYVYEFALGMGPRLFSFQRPNDETIYALRLIPLGGFVQLAGETTTDDIKAPPGTKLQDKKWHQRFFTIIAGAIFNFLLAFILLLMIGLVYGVIEQKPLVHDVIENYPAVTVGINKGDLIIAVNNKTVSTWDEMLLELELADKTKPVMIKVKKANKQIETYYVPLKKEVDNNQEVYRLGIEIAANRERGLILSFNYAVVKTKTLFKTMFVVISNLITGNLTIDRLAGPVGIYGIVGEQAKAGLENVFYLIAFLSVNVGFINLIPFPAFDGGRLLFLLIEKIKGSPISQKIENQIHAVGFVLLIMLLLYITFNDIIKLF
ncbi:MAG: RIP metalloprotease RseP [Bacilli bacterium]|jgi:regulator of sigma E protease|nr:RIP metalloprotease RseP [Bacilli bacterium]